MGGDQLRAVMHCAPLYDHKSQRSLISCIAFSSESNHLYVGLTDGHLEEHRLYKDNNGSRVKLSARKRLTQKASLRDDLRRKHAMLHLFSSLQSSRRPTRHYFLQAVTRICVIEPVKSLAVLSEDSVLLLDADSFDSHKLPVKVRFSSIPPNMLLESLGHHCVEGMSLTHVYEQGVTALALRSNSRPLPQLALALRTSAKSIRVMVFEILGHRRAVNAQRIASCIMQLELSHPVAIKVANRSPSEQDRAADAFVIGLTRCDLCSEHGMGGRQPDPLHQLRLPAPRFQTRNMSSAALASRGGHISNNGVAYSKASTCCTADGKPPFVRACMHAVPILPPCETMSALH